jgi:transposase-like protein
MQNSVTEERAAGVTRRRHRTIEEKRRIVQESLKPGASVAVVARRFDVNANQIFTWRRQLRSGKLTGKRLDPGGHFKISHLWPVKIPQWLDRTG